MLIFGRSLVRQNFKSISLDNQSYLPRVTLNGADTDDLRYNPFMVSLVKCDGSYVIILMKLHLLYYMFQAE